MVVEGGEEGPVKERAVRGPVWERGRGATGEGSHGAWLRESLDGWE